MCSRFSLKAATKDSFRYKKSQNIVISDAKILKAKTTECDQNISCFSDHFWTFQPASAKYVLPGSALASLEVTKTVFLN